MLNITYESERIAAAKLYQEVFKQPPRPSSSIEEMMREIKYHYEYIIMNIPQSIYWKDKHGVYLGCNQVCASLIGLSNPSDIVGLTDYDFEEHLNLPKGMADSIRKDDFTVINTGHSLLNNQEEAFTNSEGKVVYQLSGKIPFKNKEGEIIGVLGLSTDVTKLKNVQLELKDAKDKAEQANELKTKFIQNMQHDVRTPLSGVHSYMKDVAEKEQDPEKKRLAEYMVSSTGQLLLMCNEMVDFESAAYMNEAVKLEPVEIKRFLSRIVDLNHVAAVTRQLEINLEIEPNVPPHLKLDKKKLYRILVNLVGNALKFTDKGTVTLYTKLLSITSNNEVEIAFEVRDTGIGIPKDKIGLIFDKFVKLNPSNQAKYKGSGLGLYNVKNFVDSMGGKLEVESEMGNGSTFRVRLTLALPAENEDVNYTVDENLYDTQEAISSEIQKFPDTRFQQQTIEENVSPLFEVDNENMDIPGLLIVEDDPVLQKTIGLTFKKLGCQIVATVDSVSNACAAIKTQTYDLVICDLGILGGTGLDVIDWVKINRDHPNQNTPFIVLTANNDEALKKTAIEKGFLGVFQKPLHFTLAKKIIDEYVSNKLKKVLLDENINKVAENSLNERIEIEDNKFIDIEATVKMAGDMDMVIEIFSTLNNMLPLDRVKLEKFYEQNDIEETRKILHRLDGTFRYCIVPKLQLARGDLHEAVRTAEYLHIIRDKYTKFYEEIDNFLLTYNQLRKKNIL